MKSKPRKTQDVEDFEIDDRDKLLSIAWLNRGLEISRSIARVVDQDGRFIGTGFLIARNLLMTCHHVLPNEEAAKQARVQFNYQLSWQGKLESVWEYRLRPEAFFKTSHDAKNHILDYTIVYITSRAWNRSKSTILAMGRVPEPNDNVYIIQHPAGSVKRIALSDNKVIESFNDFVDYITETQKGSSGSPVFNQRWELVALHSAGGEFARSDGMLRNCNRGIQIKRIFADVGSLDVKADEGDDEIGSKIDVQALGKPEDTLYSILLDVSLQRGLMNLIDSNLALEDAKRQAIVFLDSYPDIKELLSSEESTPNPRIDTALIPAIVAGAICAFRWRKRLFSIRALELINSLPIDLLVEFLKQNLSGSLYTIDEIEILKRLREQADIVIKPIVATIQSHPEGQAETDNLPMIALLGFRIGVTAYTLSRSDE